MSGSSEFAKRQLERMGWTEGSGLGKERQGRATPILVQKRSDETGGLGIEQEKARLIKHTVQTEWWKDTLGDTLARLSGSKKKKRRKLENSSGDETKTRSTKLTYTDEELFVATGGARFGMRAGITRNQAKWRRTEEDQSRSALQNETSLAILVENERSPSSNYFEHSTNHDSVASQQEVPANEAVISKSKKAKKKDKGAKSSGKGTKRRSSEESLERSPKEKSKKPKKAKKAK